MRRALFGEAGYGLDSLGTEESVATISVEDLRALHARLTRPDNCVLAIFGDVKAVEVRAAVEHALGAWQPGATVVSTKAKGDAIVAEIAAGLN